MWRLCKRNNIKRKIMRRKKQNTNSIGQTIANVKNPLMAKVLEALKGEGLEFSSLSTGNGYYIFEFGDETVCHFTVNGVKRWLFGIWAFEDETEGTHEKVYRVSLFGEHTDYIDKFKPTATKLSETFVVKDQSEIDDGKYEIYDFADTIKAVKAHPALEKWFHYTTRTGSVAKFLLSDFWFYRIRKNVSSWLKNNAMHWYLKLVSAIYILRFRRKGVNFKSDVEFRGENWHPMYELRAIYGDNEEDTVLSTYNKLQRERKNKLGYLETKHWLLPRCVENNTNFINAQNDNDWRGFYYQDTDEND